MSAAEWQGRHVVITGGTGALGRAVVALLLARGAVCHVSCLDDTELAHCPFRDDPRVHLKRGIDLTSETHVRDLFAPFDARTPLWASIHLAGGFDMAPVEQWTPGQFARLMDMNALTCFLCCREAVRAMRAAAAGGRIVNVSARPGVMPELGAGMVAYTMAKAAVAALTRALAAELARERIWVNAVVPSIMDTPANRAAMPAADHAAWPTVEQVAHTIVFLASPDNAVTRGAMVPVYGCV